MGPFVYIAQSGIKAKRLKKSLAGLAGYTIEDEKGESLAGMILDTFDSVLLKKEYLLLHLEDGLVVFDLKKGSFIDQEFDGKWRFAGDLPAGPVADLLLAQSELRAFLPVAKVHIRQDKGALLDDEGKTRARYTSLIITHNSSSLSLGVVTSLRGYSRAYENLLVLFEESGARALGNGSEIYSLLGIQRYNYTSKPKLSIEAAAPAGETAAIIIYDFMGVARANEAGIIADYDTEFLHDYRVSFRKVRSVLSLFKGVYEKQKTTELKTAFAAIMQNTNRLRDLDVYLLEKQRYFSMVPEPSHAGLTLLFDFFAGQRNKELKKVRKILAGGAYKREVEGLEKLFLESKKLPLGAKGKVPAKILAATLIVKRYKEVCRIAGSINKATKDEVVHKLRISCKKLRYLMEFFSPLFDQDSLQQLIKTLKVLQDNLGKFNDYSVQQVFLRQVLDHDLDSFKGDEMQLTEAIGALTAMLYRLQKKERRQVMKNFSLFNSEETGLLFKKLFQVKEDA